MISTIDKGCDVILPMSYKISYCLVSYAFTPQLDSKHMNTSLVDLVFLFLNLDHLFLFVAIKYFIDFKIIVEANQFIMVPCFEMMPID